VIFENKYLNHKEFRLWKASMSLLKHSSQYLVGKAVPSLIQLAALAIFSRLLSPSAYGQYTLVIAGVGLANAVSFQWLRHGLLRFWPLYESRQEVIISTVMTGFGVLVLIMGTLFICVQAFVSDPVLQILLAFGLAMLCAEAFFELCQQLERSKLMPLRYGLIGFVRASASLLICTVLVLRGHGAKGLLVGTIAGFALPIILEIWFYRRLFSIQKVEWALFNKLFHYGLPLTATFALGFLIKSSDRFLVGFFLGAEEVGLYAISANLANYTLTTLMMVVNLAAFPLAIDALEKNGRNAADQQLELNFIMLFAIALPSAVGICLLSPNIATVFLGKNFRAAAVAVIPVITFGALLAGIKGYYFDLSFQLGRRTIGQVWVSLGTALLNILFNLVFIPVFGLLGAAFANVLAYAAGLCFSIILGRRVFRLPIPVRSFLKIVLATGGMALALVPLRSYRGVSALAIQVITGGLVFSLLLWKFGILSSFKGPGPELSCQDV